MSEKLLLIDGFSLLFRAYYGMPMGMTSPDGVHTNAIYGFLSVLNKMIEDEAPDYMAVAFDLPEPTFRHKLYPEYKGTRSEAPPEFKEQVPVLRKLLDAMKIPVVTYPGFEADDIMGTLAAKGGQAGLAVTVLSGDRDLLQIADPHTEIVIPKTRGGKTEYERYTPETVEEVYGVSPEGFIELKALMGDTSDNVPGLPGVGPKTAQKILAQFGSIENAKAHLAEIKPNKAMEAMRDHGDVLDLSKTLVTIRKDAPVGFDPEELRRRKIYNPDSYEMFRKLGFKSLLRYFTEGAKSGKADDLRKVPEENAGTAPDDGSAGVGILWENGVLYGIAVAGGSGETVYLAGGGFMDEAHTEMRDRIAAAGCISSDNAKLLIKAAGNESEFAESLRKKGSLFDVVIAAYLLNPLKNDWDYDDVSAGYLAKPVPSREELIGKKGIAAYLAGPGEETEKAEKLRALAVLEAETAYRAAPLLGEALKKEGMRELFDTVEMPLTFALAGMEREGIFCSRKALAEYNAQLTEQVRRLEQMVYEEAGESFNLNSPKQLGQILFEKMGLPGGKKTKTGYSTAADVLEKLAPSYPVVEHILSYRTYEKLRSTYAEGLAAYIGEDGRIRTTFNQTITATGRLSSTEPNLQNIPMRMELGRQIRKCFFPAEGCVFVDADYSQIELRVLAHMSGDENLIAAYRSAQDIHRMTASQVFHVPFDEVTEDMRRNAKAVNFGIVYGISAFGLSQGLMITPKEAADYIARYFETYPGIKTFLDGLVSSAKEKGYAVSLFGRRRPVPELRAANFVQRSFGERVAMNSPIQGTAADIMKIAMNRVYARLTEEGLKSKLILQIHDELLIEAPKEEAEYVKTLLTEEMQKAASLSVPLSADCHTGENWYEAK